MWNEVVCWLSDGLKWVVALGTAYFALRSWVIKPIQKIQDEQGVVNAKLTERVDSLSEQFQSIQKTLATVEGDVSDTLGDRLTQAHTHYMKVGWCPPAEKQRLVDMRKRYVERGHNHLAEHYVQDIVTLPEYPPDEQGDENGK